MLPDSACLPQVRSSSNPFVVTPVKADATPGYSFRCQGMPAIDVSERIFSNDGVLPLNEPCVPPAPFALEFDCP